MACAQGISRRVPPLIIIAFFFTFMGPAVVQVFLRNLVPADWGAVKVTAILAALYFSFMFWRLLVVKTQHWMGDKWSLVFGVAAYMLVPAALIFTTSYALLVVLAILWGWGAAAIWLTGPVWLYDNTNPARRGFWAGVLYMVLFAGLYIGTLLVGYAAKDASRAWMLFLLVAPGAVAVVLAAALPRRAARAEALSFAGMRSMVLDRRVIILGILLFVSATTYGLLLGAFRDRIDLAFGTKTVGIVLSWFFMARLLVSILGGHFTDIIARRSVVALAFFVGGAALALASGFKDVWALTAASVALGLVGGIVPVSATAYSADWFPPEKRSLAMGASFIWGDLGTAVSLLAGQFIAEASPGFAAPLLAFAALFLASTVLALLLPGAHRKGNSQ